VTNTLHPGRYLVSLCAALCVGPSLSSQVHTGRVAPLCAGVIQGETNALRRNLRIIVDDRYLCIVDA